MSVIRVEKNKDYTVISNLCFKEKNMSLKAKGLLTFMLSLPEDWDYSIKGLVLLCKENETGIRNILQELEEFGYLRRKKVRDIKGKIIDWEYQIFERPCNSEEKANEIEYKVTKQEIYCPIEKKEIKENEKENDKESISLLYTDVHNDKNPVVEEPHVGNPVVAYPVVGNHIQQNIYKQNTKKQSTKEQKESKKEGEENNSLPKNKNQKESFEELATKGVKMNEELLKAFPVYIDYLEFKDRTGIDLAENGALNNKDIAHVNRFLYDVHTDIYYYLLYANIKKTVKDKIIQRNIEALEEPIKLAIIYQAEYLISLGGKSVGVEDLSNIKSDGSLELLESVKIKDKIICLKSFYILQNTSPQLLYGIKDPYSINNPQGAT